MIIVVLLSLLPITSGSVMEHIFGFVEEDVLLPCGCNNPDDLVWQKEEIVVNVFPEDKSIIDGSYKDRSQLFLNNKNGNCSLLLFKISLEDAGVYSCHALVNVGNNLWSKKSLEVNLTVSEKHNIPESIEQHGDESVTAVSISVPILAMVVLLAIVFLILLIRKRRQTNTDIDLPARENMIQKV